MKALLSPTISTPVLPNITTTEIWTAVGVLPSIRHDDVMAVCCSPLIPAMTAKDICGDVPRCDGQERGDYGAAHSAAR